MSAIIDRVRERMAHGIGAEHLKMVQAKAGLHTLEDFAQAALNAIPGLEALIEAAMDYSESYAHPEWNATRTELEMASVAFATALKEQDHG